MEHLAVWCPWSLQQFCDAMRQEFGLDPFDFDFENETEWGTVVCDGIEYNVSRPYDAGMLREWDDTVPNGCNFGVTLIILQGDPSTRDANRPFVELVPYVGQRLSNLLGRRVYHHRTWLGASNNVPRHQVFDPVVKGHNDC